jgi:DNA-binding NtrC family response regulator
VPPLSERLEDIPALLAHFVEGFCRRNQRDVPQIDADVEPMLADQVWRGNVRELRQRIEEALVFCTGGRLSSKHFRRYGAQRPASNGQPVELAAATVSQTMLASQKELAQRTLDRCEGNKSRAAQVLGVSRSHLYKLLK